VQRFGAVECVDRDSLLRADSSAPYLGGSADGSYLIAHQHAAELDQQERVVLRCERGICELS